jgi:hypothetical protein
MVQIGDKKYNLRGLLTGESDAKLAPMFIGYGIGQGGVPPDRAAPMSPKIDHKYERASYHKGPTWKDIENGLVEHGTVVMVHTRMSFWLVGDDSPIIVAGQHDVTYHNKVLENNGNPVLIMECGEVPFPGYKPHDLIKCRRLPGNLFGTMIGPPLQNNLSVVTPTLKMFPPINNEGFGYRLVQYLG